MSSFSIDLSGLAGLVNDVRELGASIKEEVALAGVAGGAKVLYDEARALAPVSEAAHIFYGRNSKRTGVKYRFEPGTLRAAVYRVYADDKSSIDVKTYRISWNHTKAPYGHMVEFGTARAPAYSFIGASLAVLPQAYTAAKVEMGAAFLNLQRRNP